MRAPGHDPSVLPVRPDLRRRRNGRSPGRSCGRACPRSRIATSRGGGAILCSRVFSYSASRRVHVHVDADEVDERARSHRPAGAVLHCLVEILGRHAGLVEDADAVVQERDQDTVDDEAGRVVAADRRLADGSPNANAVSNGSSAVSSVRTISTSGISGAGLKKCIPTHALGPARRRRDLGDRERRGVRREDARRAAVRPSSAKSSPLRLELLDDRLDHEVESAKSSSSVVEREPPDAPRRASPCSCAPSRPRVEAVLDPAARRARRTRPRPRGRRSRQPPSSRPARSRRPSHPGRRHPLDPTSATARDATRARRPPPIAWPKPMHIAAMP